MTGRSKSQRIAFVTQWFAPEPSVQPVRIARGLRDAGYEVDVLTGIPNYPTGRVADGYRAHKGVTERYEGLTVTRTPLYPSHSASTLGRMLNYLSWAASAALAGMSVVRRSDVALVYSSPATAALPAMIARCRYGVPYVLLVQDVWPDSVFSSGFLSGRARIVHRLLSRFVDRTYELAARIAVISPGMRDLLVGRGVDPDKIVLVYNSVEEKSSRVTDAGSATRADWGLTPEEVVFMYAGNHGAAQDLSALVEAFGLLPPGARARLIMIGDGVEKEALQKLAERCANGRVSFQPAVPREQMSSLMQLADFQVVALADRPLFTVTMPSKVQSILAAGQPVLAVARGDVADAVSAAGAGAVAPPGDPDMIAQAIEKLEQVPASQRRAMGEAGRSYYQAEMSPGRSADTLLNALADAASTRGTTLGSRSTRWKR